MAKLTGPLFSLGASGQIAKTLVYFGWKGLNVVRGHVVPSNPRTTGQVTQRGYLTTAVSNIHTQQALFPNGLDATDIRAYALYASVVQAATTWFNQLVRLIIDQLVAGDDWTIWKHGSLTPGTDKLTFLIYEASSGAPTTTCYIDYGTSKTALIHSQATTKAALGVGVDITGLVTGVKYYARARATVPTSKIGAPSGIYYGVPT